MQERRRFPIILISILPFICLTTVVVAVSMSKPGCPDKCGNVTIPYPFGIGSGCCLNSSYLIICKNSSVPMLSSINLQVVQIFLDNNTVEVKHPVSPIACSSEQKTMSWGKSLLGSPFPISPGLNSLTVLGCQNMVWLHSNEMARIDGCKAICDANSTNMTDCSGVNCCQTPILEEFREVQFTYQSSLSDNGNKFCGYVFLADNAWFQEEYKTYEGLQHNLSNPFDEEFKYATVTLWWKIDDLLDNSPSYGCTYDYYNGYSDQRHTQLGCSCAYGYEGNPYIYEGCQDIDECRDSKFNECHYDGVPCLNFNGSYTCDYSVPTIATLRESFPSRTRMKLKISFISIGGGLGALLLLVAGWKSSRVFWKRFKAYRKRLFFKRNGGLLLEKHELSSTEKGVQKTKLFSSKELSKATDRYNENRVLGRGGQGTVYKGMLIDGRIVAVKKSKKINEGDIEVFINEVVILSQINHRNVVKLLGCCLETEIPLLVYEFIPNGTLFQHIHEPNEEFPLTWDMRVRIATDVANSLSYLHSAASAPIYHRDIKSTNILLDDKYRAKVSDFGTSRSISVDQTHLTTRVLGTFGYLDPEYFQSSQFTDKSDVYSFGVVMVELLTGEKAVSSIRADVGRSLATHFLHSMDENQLFEILDARVLKEGPREEIIAIAELARRCLDLNGKRRPTMKEVAMELEGIQMSKEKAGFQNSVDDEESHAIDISESSDFSSISESSHLDTIISNSSDAHPCMIHITREV